MSIPQGNMNQANRIPAALGRPQLLLMRLGHWPGPYGNERHGLRHDPACTGPLGAGLVTRRPRTAPG